MSRKCKGIVLMWTVVLLFVCNLHAFAADERLGTVVDGSLLTEETKAETVVSPLARGTYLSNGSGAITLKGARSVSVSGGTSAYQKVDEIKVTLHLQRLVGSQWVTVNTLGPKTAYNAYSVSNSKTYSVSGGYYYRVYGGHTVNEDGRSESIPSWTDGVWVD